MTFADRVQERRKAFKSTVDSEDTRRRREVEVVQIRKKEKEEQMARRRRLAELGSDISDVKVCLNNLPLKTESIPLLADHLRSADQAVSAESAIAIRKILSVDRNPPIQEVLDAGILPLLKNLLGNSDYPSTQLEACWALTNIASGTPEQTEAVVSAGVVPLFVTLLRASDLALKEQAVWAIANIAGDRVDYRDGCLAVGTFGAICEILESSLAANTTQLTRLSTWAFSNLCRGKPTPDLSLITPGLDILNRVLLQSNDTEVLADACWALSYITDGSGGSAIAKSIDLVRLISLLNHPSSTVHTPVLRTIGNMVSGDSEITSSVVAGGVLSALKPLILSKKRTIRKESLWAISNICADSQSHLQRVIDTGVMERVCELLRSGTSDADVRREAIWCIANGCTVGCRDQIHTLVADGRFGIMEVLSQYIESNRDSKSVIASLDAIYSVLASARRAGADTARSYSLILEECGGLTAIEDLQQDKSEEVYRACVRILETFFSCDEEDQENFVDEKIKFDFKSPSRASLPAISRSG
jgi:importin subunit alpha-6/7